MTDDNLEIFSRTDQELPDQSYFDPGQVSDIVLADSQYIELLVYYQKGEWNQCQQLIGKLVSKYPDEIPLQALEEDIEFKLLFINQEKKIAREKKRRTWISMFIVFFVVILGILLGVNSVDWLSRSFSDLNSTPDVMSETEIDLKILKLEEKAKNLIRIGNAEMALATIQEIQKISPEYPGLAPLIEQSKLLTELDVLYENAMNSINSGDYESALALFEQIKSKNQFYKDVASQIDLIEKRTSIRDLTTIAEQAYLEDRWGDVIVAYEKVLGIDPNASTPNLEEQLFMSYYERIKEILDNETSSIEEIKQAEQYYRKAVSLVPQNQAFLQERRDLQKFLVGLLSLKFQQTARSIIISPSITEESLTAAVEYQQKAVSLTPEDTRLASELDKAQTYLLALQKFNSKQWDAAILNLEKLSRFQRNYASGMVDQMLYEAYTARGLRLLNAGYYLDAQKDLEKAEVVAWENNNNKLRLYEAQVNMGTFYGRMYNYKDAIAYYNLASGTIQLQDLIKDSAKQQALVDIRATAETQENYATFEAYRELLVGLTDFYELQEIKVSNGENLASLANQGASTIQFIQKQNGLSDSMIPRGDRTIDVPFIP